MLDRVIGVGVGFALGFLTCAASCERSEEECPSVDPRPGCTSDCGAPGSLLWERTFQGGASGRVAALTVDACGSVIATGEVRPSRFTGSEEIWVATYHADGELAWSVADRLTHGATGAAVTLHEGRIYVGGQAIVSGVGLASGDRRPLVRAYSTQGEGLQTHILGDDDLDVVDGFAMDAEGRFLALTRLGSTWTIPPQEPPVETFDFTELRAVARMVASGDGRVAVLGASATDDLTVLLLVYDSEGTEIWRASRDVFPRHVGFDGEGTLVIVDGPEDDVITVRRYLPSGGTAVAESVPLPSGVRLFASTVDQRGRVVVGGDLEDAQGLRVPWVARLSATGVEWSWTRPDLPGDGSVQSLAVDAVDAVFVGARVDVSALSGMIGSDIWIGRLAP
ncbi:MAG: hypothetical protein ACRBN8_02350 [Nannocystales bacterium]